MTEAFEVAYEDLIHDHEGTMAKCPECQARCFIKHLASYGCHMCDRKRANVLIIAKEETDG